MHEMWELSSNVDPSSRRYTTTVHQNGHGHGHINPGTDDLHAWSIYRQNLNSDFTDSALGSEERSPLPYGNFQLREQTVQSILRHPRLAPRSELANNMYAYLKFGLPRVFPQEGKSFKDNASELHGLDSVSVAARGNATATRARSETDLVNGTNHLGLISNRFKKSSRATSESNLLNGDQRDHGNHHPNNPPPNPRPMSKAGSQASLVSRMSRGRGLNAGASNRGYIPDGHGGAHDDEGGLFEYPHLQVRNLGYDGGKGKVRNLDGISFDLRGGESLAILATNGSEGTALLDILAGRAGGRGKIYGEFSLNGHPLSAERLGQRVGYVRKDYRLHPSISVEQTLSFHYLLRSKDLSTKYLSTKISSLLEELGLGSVRTALVSTLTSSERQRLVVATVLITGAELLALDDCTSGMDIFDTFFLVEFLRHWASSGTGRIVLMTIHPPTYEIFNMFTKVALLSTGRLMFYGHRRELLPYFAFIEYPCPAYKNPSDYYLDLVTLDNLSSEALLESSQRIESLADSYRRKAEPILSDGLGPPAPLPPRIKNGGFLRQFWTLLVSWIGYSFPWNVVDWMLTLLLATSVSIGVGALYWNIRLTHAQDQNNVNDRLGLHWVLVCLIGPQIVVLLASNETKELDCVTRDFEERLYSKAVYFIAKNLVELPYMLSIYLGYIIPAYVMAGLSAVESNSNDHFYAFVGYMLLYLYVLRLVFQGLVYLFRNINAATTLFAILFFVTSMSGYYTLHHSDLGEWIDWIKYFSPQSWIYQRLVYDEFVGTSTFSCPRNPLTQDTQIVTQWDCRLSTGQKVLEYFGFAAQGPVLIYVLSVVGIGFVFYLIGFFSFILKRQGVAIPPIENP